MKMCYSKFEKTIIGKYKNDILATVTSLSGEKDIIISHLITKPLFVNKRKKHNYIYLVIPSIETLEKDHSLISKFFGKYTPYFTVRRKSDDLILLTVQKNNELIISEKMNKEIKSIKSSRHDKNYSTKLNHFVLKYGFNPYDYQLKIIKGWEEQEDKYASGGH